MLKNLRLGMYQAFESSVCRRWPQFQISKSGLIEPKRAGEFSLIWKALADLEIAFSIFPNHKTTWSSFDGSIAWSRSGSFRFHLGRPTLRMPPPEYDLSAALRRGLSLEMAELSMSVLWYRDCSASTGWQRTKFKNFDESYDFPWFPLRSPIHTFNPELQEPEDYKRLEAAEKAMTVEDGRAFAQPIVDELVDHIAKYIWPFVEVELIPYAKANPWRQKESPSEADLAK